MNKYLKGKQIINCAKARRPLPEDNNQGNQGNTGGNQGNTGGNHGGLTDEQLAELLDFSGAVARPGDPRYDKGGTGRAPHEQSDVQINWDK